MKAKAIKHPKLYFDYQVIDSQIELFYYSNKLDDSGNRLAQSILIDSNSFSNRELISLNKNEYNNLLIYIARQEKVMQIYFNKKLHAQYKIVKDSLLLMYDFKKEFENTFLDSDTYILN